MGRARWKSRTEDRGVVGCYRIRASKHFSFEAEEAAIAEAASGINPLDQGTRNSVSRRQGQGRRSSRRPLSRANHPFIGPISKGSSGSNSLVRQAVGGNALFRNEVE